MFHKEIKNNKEHMNDIMNYKFSKEESTDKNVFNDDNYSEIKMKII